MVLINATFNNICVISWWSDVLMEYPEKILKIVYTSLLRVCKIHLTSIVDSFNGHGYGV
jgi:hypothetical protein